MESLDFRGDLRTIKPERLIREGTEDPVADFFVVLGLIYNDIKSLTFHFVNVENTIRSFKPDEITAAKGEFAGMKSHLERLMVGTMRGLFEFIASSTAVLAGGEFKVIHERMNADQRRRWDAIVAVATGQDINEGDMSDFLRVLVMIRSNLAFHYQSKVVRDGFTKYFYHNPVTRPENETCYYSRGDNMRDTRFFFSDAAGQMAIRAQALQKMSYDEYAKRLGGVIDDANFAIMALMKEFLRTRPG